MCIRDRHRPHRRGGGHPGSRRRSRHPGAPGIMTETIHEILSAHRFLSGLPEGTVEVLAECARAETFEAGRLLLREGDVADTFHLIHRGRVSIEIHGPGGSGLSL